MGSNLEESGHLTVACIGRGVVLLVGKIDAVSCRGRTARSASAPCRRRCGQRQLLGCNKAISTSLRHKALATHQSP